MMRVVFFLACCIDWLKRELEQKIDYECEDGCFFLILPPVS